MGADLWPIPWLSPRHALAIVSLLLLPLLQGTTAAALAACCARRFGWSAATSRAWSSLTLTAVLPLAVLLFAVRWFGFSHAAVAVDAAAWPAWMGFALGLLLLGVASGVSHRRPDCIPASAAGAVGGTLAITCWALGLAFALTPDAWLASPSLRLAIQPPAFAPILTVHVMSTLSFLVAIVSPTHDESASLLRAVAAACAGLGCVLIVTIPWWLPPETLPSFARDALEQGGLAHTTRWAVVTLSAWFSLGLVSTLASGALGRNVALVLIVVVTVASQAVWGGYRGPWAVRGWLYENGTDQDAVRVERRSPLRPRADGRPLGARLFDRQCATCHARQGPLADWYPRLSSSTETIRERLEEIREADRPGHRYRDVMPPLIGSDEEVDALSEWVRGGPSWATSP
jgi:mono/diheme cytochrome c family protein